MDRAELLPHLFRTEYSKITAVLCKLFGIDKIEIAEDIASETFLAALETWTYKGIPDNPVAWLYAVAKNKAKNVLARNHVFAEKVTDHLKNNSESQFAEIDLSDQNISDSQLQMLFALCHPSISTEAQIGLSLRILCGFGIDEIANAFVTNKETINKRLFRAKENLREEKVKIEFPGISEINNRLETVLRTLYLLFNEGYYSESENSVLREDLCLEAMRLTSLLIENSQTNLPAVNALYALMCFHASRFKARKNAIGEIILYADQDETLWDYELISKGGYFLNQASRGDEMSKYHIEAAIAYWNTQKLDTIDKWRNILQLYDHLLSIEFSPMAALDRIFAISKVDGKQAGIKEAEKIDLSDNHFYFALLGELYSDVDDRKAKSFFQKSLVLAKTESEKNIIQKKIDRLT